MRNISVSSHKASSDLALGIGSTASRSIALRECSASRASQAIRALVQACMSSGHISLPTAHAHWLVSYDPRRIRDLRRARGVKPEGRRASQGEERSGTHRLSVSVQYPPTSFPFPSHTLPAPDMSDYHPNVLVGAPVQVPHS